MCDIGTHQQLVSVEAAVVGDVRDCLPDGIWCAVEPAWRYQQLCDRIAQWAHVELRGETVGLTVRCSLVASRRALADLGSQ
jgi:hypothetical protein